ncbi:YiaA/YiaB family inner membrane protein [Cohaesibacter haloalkalitolerans]|uniref:YiaA/YiaB family inner membrane protein n=1 Tax=Cohaesibacter haloalkalitolerans TaxID=1162980 RepID=UPI000E64CFB8|nr:YiaA/YiaB family inner membrane protein [Cohaesibacter haloalkalitolerans]
MQTNSIKHSESWHIFTMVSFAIAVAMMAGGIYFLEASFSAKGFYAMAAIMLVHTSITLTKTLRDREEADKLHNRIEDAKTEKLLMNAGPSD